MNSIEIKNLTKNFNELRAVDNVSLEIKEGELFGLLGPNGAGKTTLIKMLSTLLKPISGEATVWNYNVIKDRDLVRRSIGIVFQDPAVDDELTGEENLDFHARMYGMPAKKRKERIKSVLNLVDLFDKRGILVRKYSGGMRRRLEIARGFMHNPKVLFLDEPTLGLDAQTRRKIWNYIKNLNKKENITIVLTTHYMEEADSLCNRIGIMDHGKILVTETPNSLKNMIGSDVITMRINKNINKFNGILKKKKWVDNTTIHGDYIDIGLKNAEERIPKIVNIANKNKIIVDSITMRKPTLEDVYLNYTGKTIREEETNYSKIAMKRGMKMRGGH